ncbi:MAG: 30S ribosomal protein S17 [Candidatus Nanohaloarchaea archaeon]
MSSQYAEIAEQEGVSIRGGVFVGEVQSTKMEKSATVRWEYSEKIEKYERYERRNTKITAHVPESVEVREGDQVRVAETRPISKTKSHVIVEKVES